MRSDKLRRSPLILSIRAFRCIATGLPGASPGPAKKGRSMEVVDSEFPSGWPIRRAYRASESSPCFCRCLWPYLEIEEVRDGRLTAEVSIRRRNGQAWMEAHGTSAPSSARYCTDPVLRGRIQGSLRAVGKKTGFAPVFAPGVERLRRPWKAIEADGICSPGTDEPWDRGVVRDGKIREDRRSGRFGAGMSLILCTSGVYIVVRWSGVNGPSNDLLRTTYLGTPE